MSEVPPQQSGPTRPEDPSSVPQTGEAAVGTLARKATELARRWVAESAATEADPAAARLAGVLKDADGLPFTVGFVDGVMRPESLSAAASNLQRTAPLVPGFLPWYQRVAVRAGGLIAPVLPAPTVPIARRVLRSMVGHLIVDARPDKLGAALTHLRGSGHRLNLNLLGEAVLGEAEAQRRLEGIHDLVRRADVDYVSVKVSAIVSHLSMWAFEEVVDLVVERLTPLYLTAVGNGTFINLDMEEYRDLDLTIAVFTRLLDDPRLHGLEAGIVLQAYLPDALGALRELTTWATARVDAGGAPIKVRLVKGANLAMEKVDAVLHGWAQAPYDAKVDTDANYLRCLDDAMDPDRIRAVRLGVAGHNLFDVAYAWLLAGERGVRDGIEFEMLLGMAQGQVEAVSREVGPVLLYVPVVKPDEFDVAISYLVRRLEENASSDNYLSAAFALHDDEALFDRERDRFLASVARRTEPTLWAGPRRQQDRGREERLAAQDAAGRDDTGDDAPEERLTHEPADETEQLDAGLTQAVLGIAAGDGGDTQALSPDAQQLFGGSPFVETAVFASRESVARPAGAPGFRNVPDSDPALPANRAWAREILARVESSTAGDAVLTGAQVHKSAQLDKILARVQRAAKDWGALPAASRSEVLRRVARVLGERRGLLIEVAASETGKVFAEGDVEVSEAVDYADYYAATARELDRVTGAVFTPSQVTVVTPPWNFPIAIPAGGVLAALAAGSGVVFKPAHQARRCGAVLAEALWDAGIPRDLLALVTIDEGDLGRALIEHTAVDRVILTGSWDTAALFRSWRSDLPLLAETSGKNAIIVTPSADLDLAAKDVAYSAFGHAGQKCSAASLVDLVKSAFGHAGQKCSAASLAILVGPVARSERFMRQLTDAVTSLRVGPPSDPQSEVGPVIEVPHGKLEWALTELGDGEKWLVKPEPVDLGPENAGRYWRPGVRTGVRAGSRFHREEFFGPVLGIMHASTLAHAIELQNAVAYGLTAGLHTQNPSDLATWLDRVEAGNLYVNRGITGAIVQRQSFGGWKRSSVGAGTKAGGPNYLIGLGSWRATEGGRASSSLHLRGLDTRITALIEASQPSLKYEEFDWLRRSALSDAIAWDREFGQVKDVSQLRVERNLFRYRPVPVAVRAVRGASTQQVLRVIIAAVRAGSPISVSLASGLPAEVRRALGELRLDVFVETGDQWCERMATGGAAGTPVQPGADAATRTGAGSISVAVAPRPGRVRLVGPPDATAKQHRKLSVAVEGDPDLAVYDGDVTTAGRLELLPFLHEQSISITAHRFGDPDGWSESVI